MCGRYTLAKSMEDIRALVGEVEGDVPLAPRYNIAPTQPTLAVIGSSPRSLSVTVWGLVPFWAKDPSIGSRLINARAETIDTKPAFRTSFKSKRCLVLADGFYEWKKEPGKQYKTPIYVTLQNGELFAFAGLWSHWQGPDGTERVTSTIITTRPNRLLADIHDRMPVILPPEAHDPWLDPDHFDRELLKGLLEPFPAERMRAASVSRKVNNVRHDAPDCIEPVLSSPAPGQAELF